MRSIVFGAFVAFSLLSSAVVAGENELSEQRVSVSIRDQNVLEVFDELSSATGLLIVSSPAVNGRVTVDFDDASVVELLDSIASQRALDWSFDGRRVEVTARSEQMTRMLDLDGVLVAELTSALSELNVYQERFPISAVDGEFAIVVAPPNYVAIVEVVLSALVERRVKSDMARLERENERREMRRAQNELYLEQQRALHEHTLEMMRLRNGQALRGPTVIRNGIRGGLSMFQAFDFTSAVDDVPMGNVGSGCSEGRISRKDLRLLTEIGVIAPCS